MSYQSKFTGTEIDTLLSSIGGINATKKILWEGKATKVNEVLTLAESIENFDYIYVECGFMASSGTNRRYFVPSITLVDTIKTNGYGETHAYYGGNMNTGESHAMSGFYFTTSTTIKIKDVYTSTSNIVPTLYKVVGIKLSSSGTGGGGSYKEAELLSEPVSYTLNASINKELALLDDVTNYDEIVYNYCLDYNSGEDHYTNTEYRVLVSNIVYNNLDSAINDNETVIMPIFTSDIRCIQFWFKTPNKMFIYKTTGGGTTAKYAIKITSIKGIKYESVANNEGVTTELPIATADTLGGIKVGEGLEISEDGILKVLSSKGDVTTLLSERTANLKTDYALSDNINNYDMLVVQASLPKNGGLITALPIVNPQINKSYAMGNHHGNDNDAAYFLTFAFTSETTIQQLDRVGKGDEYWQNVSIDAIYGIKLGASAGSGTKRNVLWEGTESTVGNTITLSDSIENYDELYIETGYFIASGAKRVAPSTRLDVNSIVTNGYGETIFYGSGVVGNFKGMYSQACLYFTDATSLKFGAKYEDGTNATRTSIYKVIGIKY